MTIRIVGLLFAVAAWAVVFAAGDLLAQGHGSGGQGAANYNVAAETTVKGTVTD